MIENRKVFVSGMGIVSSDSIGCYEFNKFLQDEKSAIRKVNDSTLCPCDEFVQDHVCRCKLYVPIENDKSSENDDE